MKTSRLLTLIFLSLFVTACGFQLRGQSNISQTINEVAINAGSKISISLKQLIERQLKNHDIASNNAAEYSLTINELASSKRSVATTRTSFNDRFLLRQTLHATLKKADQEWPITTYSERVFSDNRNTPSAKSREQQSIEQELITQAIEDLADQIRNFHAR